MSERIIFYDIEKTGHHLEYFDHLIEYYEGSDIGSAVIFIAHPDIFLDRPEFKRKYSAQSENKILVHPISQEEFDKSFSPKITLRRSVKELRLLSKYVLKFNATKVFVFHLNVFQFPFLKLPNNIRKLQFSGIFFHPYISIDYPQSFIGKLKTFATKRRKKLQMRFMLSFFNFDKIYLFNDSWGVDRLNQSLGSKCFKELPDPVLKLPKSSEVIPELSLSKDIVLFAFVGYINRRKGLIETLKAFSEISTNLLSNINLAIMGQVDTEILNEVETHLAFLKEKSERFQALFFNGFISEGQLDYLLTNCDYVLIPYLKTQGSSGLLGHAANHGKPSVGPKSGLIGRLIRDYNLGYSIDPNNTKEFSDLLIRLASDEVEDEFGFNTYVEERSTTIFAKTIFDDLGI